MACVRWSSESRTTRAPPPSNPNWHAGMTFGSAIEFSLFPLKRNGDLRMPPWVRLAKRSVPPNMAWRNGRRRAQFAAHGERSNRERRPRPTIRAPRLFAPERPRHGQASHDRGVERASLPWLGRAGPARLPFTPALLAKAHLFGKVRTRLGVIRRNHRIIGREAPFLAVFVW